MQMSSRGGDFSKKRQLIDMCINLNNLNVDRYNYNNFV